MVRSIAEVCELEVVEEVLDSAPGFALLDQGTLPFVGREGGKLWEQLVDTIAERWDDVIDALDDLVTTPRVDMTALAAAEKEAEELAAREDADAVAAGDVGDDDGVDDRELDALDDEDARGRRRRVRRRPRIRRQRRRERRGHRRGHRGRARADVLGAGRHRPHPHRHRRRRGADAALLPRRPADLPRRGRRDRHVPHRAARSRGSSRPAREGNDLASVSTWADVVERAAARELEVEVDPLNVYVLPGLDDDIAEGPTGRRPHPAGAGRRARPRRGRLGGRRRAARRRSPSRRAWAGWCRS